MNVRLVFGLFVVLLLMLGVRNASAQTVPSSDACRPADKCSQPAAYSVCMSTASVALARAKQMSPNGNFTGTACAAVPSDGHGPFYRCQILVPGSWTSCGTYVTQFDYFYDVNGSCAKQPSLRNVAYQGATYCQSGCVYEPDDVAQSDPNSVDFSFFNSPSTIRSAKRMRPTGGTCQSLPDPPEKQPDVCATQGTLTQCVTPEGNHCAQSSSGKKFCWEPKEHGTKTSGNEAMTKSPADKPVNIPPVPPKNGGEWEKKEQVTMSTTINNVTDNSKITNQLSSYGSGGSGASGGGASGQPNAGSGDGGGKGQGEGEGPGKGDFGTVSGGGRCDQTFSCSGGDPVLCAIATQQYLARCEASDRAAGGDGVGDFPGGGDSHGDPNPEDYNRTVKVGISMLDTGGLGMSNQCPRFDVGQTSWGDFSLDQESFCEILAVARMCLLFIGAFMALGILMGWGGKD